MSEKMWPNWNLSTPMIIFTFIFILLFPCLKRCGPIETHCQPARPGPREPSFPCLKRCGPIETLYRGLGPSRHGDWHFHVWKDVAQLKLYHFCYRVLRQLTWHYFHVWKDVAQLKPALRSNASSAKISFPCLKRCGPIETIIVVPRATRNGIIRISMSEKMWPNWNRRENHSCPWTHRADDFHVWKDVAQLKPSPAILMILSKFILLISMSEKMWPNWNRHAWLGTYEAWK